jgi:3'-phosphoadenosine 5'-phosphosulfate sulfotransferase (PAPS reductase)/FAD synthetase
MITKKELHDVKVTDLIPYQKNPRKNDQGVLRVAESLKSFGLVKNSIVVDETLELLTGHTTLKGIILLKWPTVPDVTQVIGLSESQKKAYRIADNKTGEFSTWDKDLLIDELSDLKGLDFDLSLTGFDDNDLDKLIRSVDWKKGESLKKSINFKTDVKDALSMDEEAESIFEGKEIITVTYSGGKDSTAALLWVKANFPTKRIVAVFSDTGYEFPGMALHVYKVCKFLGVELKIVKPKHDMIQDILDNGWFSTIILPCRFKYIYEPVQDYIREKYKPDEIIITDGSRGDQATKKTKKTKTSGSADAKMKEYQYYHPCFDIAKETQEKIITDSGVPVWDGYSKGFVRTSCWLCPGMNSKQAYAVSQYYPWAIDKIKEMEEIRGQKWKFLVDKSCTDVLASKGLPQPDEEDPADLPAPF